MHSTKIKATVALLATIVLVGALPGNPVPPPFAVTLAPRADLWAPGSVFSFLRPHQAPSAASASASSSSSIASAARPTSTMHIGEQLVSVGTFDSSNVTKTIKAAIQEICADAVANIDPHNNKCSAKSATFEASYIVGSGLYTGDVTVTVTSSNFTSIDQYNAILNTVLFGFKTVTAGPNCKNEVITYGSSCGGNGFETTPCPHGTVPQCKTPSTMIGDLINVNPVTGGAEELAYMAVSLEYSKDNPETWDCSRLLGTLGLALGFIPIGTVLGTLGSDLAGTIADSAGSLVGGLSPTCGGP